MGLTQQISRYKRYIVLIGLLVGAGSVMGFLPTDLFGMPIETVRLIYLGLILASGFVFMQYYRERPVDYRRPTPRPSPPPSIPRSRFRPRPSIPVRRSVPPEVPDLPDTPDDEIPEIPEIEVGQPAPPPIPVASGKEEDIYRGFT